MDRLAFRLRRVGSPAGGPDGGGGKSACGAPGVPELGPGQPRTARRPGLGYHRDREGVCRSYLGDLDYGFSYRHLAGLTDFFRRLAHDGLVPDGSLSFISAA